MTQLLCRDLSAGYGSNVVVKGLNFSVNDGDYVCIIGPNGAGKSTIMRTLLGLLPPLSGEIIRSFKPNETGYLPQQSSIQKDFPASVWEVVLSGCQGICGLRPFYNSSEKSTAIDAMKRMNIEDLKRKCYPELSGGQQQRVLLARALCAAKKILFLDEPVSGLDPEAASDMYRTIHDINVNYGITVIMISHDTDKALKYAGKILRIGDSNND